MRVLIYGGGAVGLGIASCLIKAGHYVDIIARPQTVAELKAQGLLRKGLFGTYQAGPDAFGASSTLDQLSARPYDFILVCTKSFDSQHASEDIYEHRQLLGPNTRIVLFQNGWGNAEVFAKQFEQTVIYNARVITGFERPRPNQVNITVHAAPITIGSLFDQPTAHVETLAAAISAGGIPAQTTQAIEKDLWSKMLFNCTLNPLGAILGVPYGDLAAHPSTRFLMDRIVEEIFVVLKASGLSTHWQTPEAFLQAFYGQLIPDTAAHRSSMLQDLQRARSTEIDALNGQVIRLAERYHIPTPYNLAIYHMVTAM
jgi:2-dehydropantoate 2-reductase